MVWMRVFKIDSILTCVATIATWQYLLDDRIHLPYLFLSLFLSAAVYTANSLADQTEDKVNQPDAYHLRIKHVQLIRLVCFTSILGTAGLSFTLPLQETLFVLATLVLGLGYSFPVVGKKRLKSSWIVKVTVVPAIWAILTAVFIASPARSVPIPDLAVMMAFMFLSMFGVSNWRDIEDREGDQKANIQTLATKFTPQTSNQITGTLTLIAGIAFLVGTLLSRLPPWTPLFALFLLVMSAVSFSSAPLATKIKTNRVNQALLGLTLVISIFGFKLLPP